MNVLVTSTAFIPSVLLCGHCQLEYLEKQGKVNYKFEISHFTNRKNIEWADIIVFLRSDSDIDAYVSRVAKKAGKKLIYVLDDDLLNIPDNLISSFYYLLPSTKRNIKTIMSNCDTFLTPSPVLLKKYGDSFKNKFLISEPSLNRIQKKEKNKKIKIGFAGSLDRTKDLNDILEDAITEIVKKYKNQIEIEFIGAKPDFIDKLGLKHLPYQDGYDAYTAFMANCNWDIGLAPMPDTEFHKCKYFNKYVEYASFGIAGVYSNLEPYVYGIKNEVNGLLVNNTTKEWVEALSRLIEDAKLRKSISDECIRQANEVYALNVLAEDYLNKITYDYKKSNPQRIGTFAFAKFIIFFKRVYRKIKEQGTNFPSWLQEKIDKKLEDRRIYKNNIKYRKELETIIQTRKTLFVFASYFENRNDIFSKRVKLVDDYFKDYYKIYLTGEEYINEYLKIELKDDNHAVIECNSFDILQAEDILDLIQKSKNVLIHSVTKFMEDKISNDLFKLFDLEDVKVYWDCHGMVPEEYHKASNFHTEELTSSIEKKFYEKADVLICDDEKLIKHFKEKYKKNSIDFMIMR